VVSYMSSIFFAGGGQILLTVRQSSGGHRYFHDALLIEALLVNIPVTPLLLE
jgi:hypothetical protein